MLNWISIKFFFRWKTFRLYLGRMCKAIFSFRWIVTTQTHTHWWKEIRLFNLWTKIHEKRSFDKTCQKTLGRWDQTKRSRVPIETKWNSNPCNSINSIYHVSSNNFIYDWTIINLRTIDKQKVLKSMYLLSFLEL